MRTARFKNKKRGWTGFDLDRDFVKDLIQNGCKYCEAKNIQMSLDRIDNNKGYTRDNVNPSCIRCNHIRGSMPYEAWREIYPSIRRAYELGLLSDWWIDSKRNNKPSRHVDQDASTGMKDAHEA